MDDLRIWLTGAGLVTPLGATLEASWGPLVRGERAIGPVKLFDVTGQKSEMAAEVKGLHVPDGAWSRTSVMALDAAREAMRAAGIDPKATRVGLVIGATTGGMFETESLLAKLHADPHAREVLAEMLTHPLTATGDRLNEAIGPFSRIRTICSACSGGANAFIVAAEWLLAGEVDVVVAGGSDGLCRLTFTGFNALGAMDREPCRPFDRRRRGLSLGEGGGFAVLERASRAKSRGAKPLCELAGWALGAEAHHITNPEPNGAVVARLMKRALARAGLTPAHLDYVNAHGTGTPLNDPMEAAALAQALGEDVKRVPVSSSKAQIGHTLAAAGAIEGIVSAMCIARQTVVPTAGLDEPDPACPLLHVPNIGHAARVRAVMSNSFGFGGMDSVLIFTEPELGPPKSAARAKAVVTGAASLSPLGIGGAADAAKTLDRDAPHAGYELDASLDVARARRLDRMARLAAVVVERAAKDAGLLGDDATGVVMGSAFGSLDASAAFMHRYYEKGPRFAAPAEFPNLVPSSPVGHVSIYLGMRGPVFATADLSASGESAFAQAVQLVATGDAPRVIACAAEERSDIVERVLLALFARSRAEVDAARAEGSAAVVVESAESAAARGAKVLAEVVMALEWRDAEPATIPGPRDAARAEVVLPRENHGIDALLARTGWRDCPRRTCAAETGEHDGLGAVALAAAIGRMALGHAREVLVVGLAKGRGYAFVLARPES